MCSANAREAKLVDNPVHVELKVGVNPESVGSGTSVPPAGDSYHTVARVRVLGEQWAPAVPLKIIFTRLCWVPGPSLSYIASVRVGSHSTDHPLSDPGLSHEKLALVPGHGDQLCLQQDGGDDAKVGVSATPACGPGVVPVAVVRVELGPAGRPDHPRGTDGGHL